MFVVDPLCSEEPVVRFHFRFMARGMLLAVCALSLVLLCFAPHALAKEEEGMAILADAHCPQLLHAHPAPNALLVSSVLVSSVFLFVCSRPHSQAIPSLFTRPRRHPNHSGITIRFVRSKNKHYVYLSWNFYCYFSIP